MNRLNEQQMRDRADRHMRQHIAANKIKDALGHQGYVFTMSLYGVIINPETRRPEYRRIEIFIKGVPGQYDVVAIKSFFRELIPLSYYSIWAYDKTHKQIIQVDSFQ